LIFPSLILSKFIMKNGDTSKTCISLDSPIHGEHSGASYKSLHHFIHNAFVSTCNLFSLYLKYKLIFLLLLLCRAAIQKVFGWNFADAYIWICTLWIFHSQEFQKRNHYACSFAYPVTFRQINIPYTMTWCYKYWF